MDKIQYLVTEPDTFVDLPRALDDISWARAFDNLDEAESYATYISSEQLTAIHKFYGNKWDDILAIIWDEDIFRKGQQ
jgi:hypothetical protein